MKILRAILFLCGLIISSTALAQQTDVPEWFFNNDGKTYIGVSMPGAPREQAVLCALLYMMFDIGSVNVDSATDSHEVFADGKRTYDSQSHKAWNGDSKCDYDIIREERLDSGETIISIAPGTTCHADIRFVGESSLSATEGKTQSEINMTAMSIDGIMWSFTSKRAGNGAATVKSRYITADGKEIAYTGESITYGDNVHGQELLNDMPVDLESEIYVSPQFVRLEPCLGAALVENLLSMPLGALKQQTASQAKSSPDGKSSESITKTTRSGKLPPTRFINISVEDNMLKALVQTDTTEK